MKPPYTPIIESGLDVSNIDRMFTREAPRETPDDGNMLLKKAKFDNFTYIEKNGGLYGSGDANY